MTSSVGPIISFIYPDVIDNQFRSHIFLYPNFSCMFNDAMLRSSIRQKTRSPRSKASDAIRIFNRVAKPSRRASGFVKRYPIDPSILVKNQQIRCPFRKAPLKIKIEFLISNNFFLYHMMDNAQFHTLLDIH